MIRKNEENENEKENEKEIKKYSFKNCPEELENKLECCKIYYKNNRKKNDIEIKVVNNDEESEASENDDYEESEEEKENKETNPFYIKEFAEKNNNYFLILSDGNNQTIFKDKVMIVMSDQKDCLLCIDKDKQENIIPTFNVLNNSRKDLTKRLKYIRNFKLEQLKEKLIKKYKMTHPDYHEEK